METNEILKLILDKVSTIDEDVRIIKTDVSTLKEDVKTLKEDVKTLKEDVSVLKDEMKTVKIEIKELNQKVNGITEQVAELVEHNTNTKYQMEELQAISIANTREIVKLKNQRDIDASTEIVNQVLENIRNKNR